MNLAKLVLAVGSTVGAARVLRSVQNLGADDVLASIGLERHRSTFDRLLPAAGWIGLGALVGAGAALLLAPSSGKELRARVSNQLDEAKARIDNGIRTVEGAAAEYARSNDVRST